MENVVFQKCHVEVILEEGSQRQQTY